MWRGTLTGKKGCAILPPESILNRCVTVLSGTNLSYYIEKCNSCRLVLFSSEQLADRICVRRLHDEGKVFWQDINQLANLNLASSFLEMADMMLHSTYSEFVYEIDGEHREKKFY